MAILGRAGLLLAAACALYGLVAACVGARRNRPLLVDSARRTAFASLGLVVAVNATMLAALLRNDFAIRYVAENSSRETPTFYKVLSLWAADDGSLLFWNLILAGFIAVVAVQFRRQRPATLPYALAVLYAVQLFYLALVNGPVRPFATLPLAPPDGRGPTPLLQNHPLMAVHPPFLYLGFIGFTVPFAFGVAALLVGPGSSDWTAAIRRWTLTVWCFLTIGLLLGALWSYSVLGWGGYWAWDPVENVALLPWLVATAFVHSVMLERRRGVARTWNLVLVVAAFSLMTFGTFLTRGNVLSSVHAFTESGVGPAYLVFLSLAMLVGFGLVAWRLPALRTSAQQVTLLSREAAFVGNNALLLAAAGVILLGTVFPLLIQAANGQQIAVGAPYFNGAVAPVFLLLLLLAGTAPVLPWRGGNLVRATRRLRLPIAAAAAVMAATAFAGVTVVAAVVGFGLATLVAVTNGQEIVRGVIGSGHPGIGTAVARGRRRYAGLLVHVGLAVLAAGITASANLAHQTETTLHQGQAGGFDGYILRYDRLDTRVEPQRTVLTARVTVRSVSTGSSRTLSPAMNLYPSSSSPIGSPAIHRGAVWDLYASLISLQRDGASATFRFYANPGVNWLWAGGALMAVGGIAAAWPSRTRRRSRGRRAQPGPADRELVSAGGRS